jgi:hypothetical protein
MFMWAIVVLPIVALVLAALTPQRFAVRLGAVGAIAFSFAVGLTGLIAPHRLAEETASPNQPKNQDWQQGARDTRDVVYRVIPLVSSSFVAAALLALGPTRAGR